MYFATSGVTSTADAPHPDAIFLRGVIQMPGFQRGSVPYKMAGDGGEIAYDASGKPIVTHAERTRVIELMETLASSGWQPGRPLPEHPS